MIFLAASEHVRTAKLFHLKKQCNSALMFIKITGNTYGTYIYTLQLLCKIKDFWFSGTLRISEERFNFR